MKKIFLIIISCLFLNGCNYVELNDMGIVTLMAINYDNNKYNITLELRENSKEDEEISTIYNGSGSSMEEALQELSLTIDKKLYFIDLNIILIDKNTVNEKFPSIVDYLTRNVNFGTTFNIIIDDNPKETIKLINNKKKIAGEYIENIFDNNSNNLINYKYDEFLKDYLSDFKDIVLPLGNIENNEYIINKAVIFKNDKIVSELDLEMVQTFNLLNNIKADYFYKVNYKDKALVFRVISHNAKIKYINNSINITVKINGSFIEIEDIDILDEKVLTEVLNQLNNKIKSDIETLIQNNKTYDSDTLSFKKSYYNKERKRINTIKNLNYIINLDLDLNRNGLLFNSLGENNENK